MNNEIWKDIPGYEGLYQVSNMGNVKSLNYNNTGSSKNLQMLNYGKGYYYVQLCLNGKIKSCRVNRLVAQAFVSNPDNLPCVNHRNEIKTDNRAENLEWCSYHYNNTYGTRMKRILPKIVKPVIQFYNNKPIQKYYSLSEAEQQTGISYTSISRVCRGIRYSAGGFGWKYAD